MDLDRATHLVFRGRRHAPECVCTVGFFCLTLQTSLCHEMNLAGGQKEWTMPGSLLRERAGKGSIPNISGARGAVYMFCCPLQGVALSREGKQK